MPDEIQPIAQEPVAPPTPAPAPQPSVTPAPQPERSPLFARAAEVGFEADRYQNVEQLAEDLLNRYREREPYVQAGRRYLAERGPEPKPEPKPAEEPWTPTRHFQEKWQAPKFDEEWTRLLQTGLLEPDENTGLYRPRQGYEVALGRHADKLNEYQEWKRKAISEFLFTGNPYERVWETFQEPLTKMLEDRLEKFWGDRFGTYEARQFEDDFEAQNANWLYRRDQAGEFQRDQAGSFVPTDHGRKFLEAVQTLKQSGISDSKTLLSLAYRFAGPPAGQAAPAQPVAPAPAAPQPTTFVADALERARHNPSGGAGAIQHEAPVNMTSRELDNLFISRAASANS